MWPAASLDVQGRLGDLGTIDDKYDAAITNACPALSHIVVQDSGAPLIQPLELALLDSLVWLFSLSLQTLRRRALSSSAARTSALPPSSSLYV